MTAITYLYDVRLPNDYAATIQIVKTGRALVDAGFDFTLATAGLSRPAEEILAGLGVRPHPNFRLTQVFPDRPRHSRLRQLILPVMLKTRAPYSEDTVLMSRGETGLAVARGLPAARRPVFVFEVHRLLHIAAAEMMLERKLRPGEPLPRRAHALRRREEHAFAAADGLLFLTDEVRRASLAAFPGAAPSAVAPSGVEPPAATGAAGPAVDLVFSGKMERRKGVHVAIDALRHLPGMTMRCVGGEPGLAEARRLADQAGVGDRIEFTGRVPHAEVGSLLADARVALCPLPAEVDHVSERFTSPLKLLEAMAAGLPVVAADLPSVRAICTDGEDALLVPPDSPEAVAAAVRRLLGDPALAERLGHAARRRAEDFTWAKRAATIAALIADARSAVPRR